MAKRANGEGHYRKTKSGLWSVQVMDGYTPEGKRNILTFTEPTKGEAQQKLRSYFEEKARKNQGLGENMPFSHWADIWYQDYQGQVQPSTYSGYRYTLQSLQEHFRDTPLRDIRQLDVNAFLTSLERRGYSSSKVTKCKAMLIQIFGAAKANELIRQNPAIDAKSSCGIRDEEDLFGDDTAAERGDSYTEEEYEYLMRYLPENLMGNSIRTLLVSGIRVQELLALTKEDIAPDGSEIRIQRAVKMVDGKAVLGAPKSKHSRRKVPIPEDGREYVRYLRENGGPKFIWTSARSESSLYAVGSFRKMFCRMVGEIPAVRTLTPHCCRHTYVTRLQAGGVPMEIIARLAGHRSPSITDGYAHASMETLARAVSVLGETVSPRRAGLCLN